nr:838_t:CDS:10 [Entrophospora candida]
MSSSKVFIINALENIGSSKEGKRNKKLKESINKALETIKNEESDKKGDAVIIFEPLQIACQTRVINIMIIALDCIGKLISYNYLIESNNEESPIENVKEKQNLIDLVIDTICDCFVGENTDDKVQLQIIKALLAAVSSIDIPVHHSSLLKSIRTSYNIFLLSKNPTNQTVAQENKKNRSSSSSYSVNSKYRSRHVKLEQIEHSQITENDEIQKVITSTTEIISTTSSLSTPTAVEFENVVGDTESEIGQWKNAHNSVDDLVRVVQEEITDDPSSNITDTSATAIININDNDNDATDILEKNLTSKSSQEESRISQVAYYNNDNDDNNIDTNNNNNDNHNVNSNSNSNNNIQEDLFVKDAFLVFRALCKLSMKPVPPESSVDLKSHSMRSKLLSLHLILTILSSHIQIFTSSNVHIISTSTHESTIFIQAVKQYLCLSLSRNAVSSVPQVFEISLEIFWKCISKLRNYLKIEVFFNEIFLPIIEMRNSSIKQKYALMNILSRICSDPQTLVEIYLNYDCDREAVHNIYERILNIISKITTTYTTTTSSNNNIPDSNKDRDVNSSTPDSVSTSNNIFNIPPSLTTNSISNTTSSSPNNSNKPAELALKNQGLECLVSVLRSLVAWCSNKSTNDSADDEEIPRQSEDTIQEPPSTPTSLTFNNKSSPTSSMMSVSNSSNTFSGDSKINSSKAMDDPEQFENLKHRKQVLQDGFILSDEPVVVAKFLLNTEGFNKSMIGEYLGEGDEENIAIMHAFVDLMNFKKMKFVDALRQFLQSFRLPGEAQKIDRFMLKFAERYVDGNPEQFANADTAYVLAYSVIMLNTDLHNPQIKRRMTKIEFIKNNRGIDDNSDLPDEFLNSIYDEISNNEIKMKDEQDAALMQQTSPTPSSGIGIASIGNAIVNVGRDYKKEAYNAASQEMANKTEQLFKSMLRAQRRGIYTANTTFYSASHFEHVKPMFEVAWMPVLAGLSGPLQNTEDVEISNLALEGFKLAIRIVCLFDMELERNAFVTTLAKFTFLNNLGEMKSKNVDAIKTLLEVSLAEGNYLKGSWRDVLTCVSQLERFQLISTGVDQTTVPDLFNARKQPRVSLESTLNHVALESRSSQVVVAVDRIFNFVSSLSSVSWEEIQSSSMAEHPRIFSLQKIVEISYYNMGRIRMEWSNVWAILGEHFNQVGCHPNINIGFFAVDSLRQLAMQFLHKDELPHFKFQKDFLRPFGYILANNSNISIKDMILRCIQQMIQARSHNIKSGWKSIFGVLTAAAKEPHESIVVMAFDLTRLVIKDHFDKIVSNSTYPDLMVCLSEFCKNKRFQKTSLQANELICQSIPKMIEDPHYQLNGQASVKSITNDDPLFKFWYPLLFGFHDIIMNGEDLEVRTRALNSMFDTLKKYGSTFSLEFWDVICRQILFPIFGILKSKSDITKLTNHEDTSVWLSTTMVQALRNMIDLFTFYFDILAIMMDGILDLLSSCITQDNDTLARIGSSCLQQLIEANVKKLQLDHWEKISIMFVNLFENTTTYKLLDEDHYFIKAANKISEKTNGDINLYPEDNKAGFNVSTVPRTQEFNGIIVNCLLQILLIDTIDELLNNVIVYESMPAIHLLIICECLEKSYLFAQKFNDNRDLRVALWKIGFTKQLPNLLRQETSSASTYFKLLVKMYFDISKDRQEKRTEVQEKLILFCVQVFEHYNSFNPESQKRNINAWTPIITEILNVFNNLKDNDDSM